MKHLNVKRIQAEKVTAKDVPALFEKKGIVYNQISTVNWAKEFPYCPDVRFAIATCEDAILVHYKVKERSVRAAATQDHGKVWEDSCVEFFSCPAGDGVYYNVECSCIGKLLIAAGSDRNVRESAPAEVMASVDRWATLGNEPFETRDEETEWEVALRIPLTFYFRHDIQSLSGKTITANFYKCGDKLPVPHFVSWNPILIENPDFHRPDFFGNLVFE